MNTKHLTTYIKCSLAAAMMALPTVVLTSCEDTLEKPSFTSDDLDFVFEDVNKAELFVKGCYRGLIHEELYRQYNSGDNVTAVCEEDLSGSKFMIGNYKYDVVMPATLTTTYGESYRIIEACNTAIQRIEPMEQSAKRDALLAEVYTLRAYAYHNLIRLYGDVPAVFEPLANFSPDDYEAYHPKRESRDVIYDRIIADINKYIEALPTFAESGYGSAPERLTRQGAYGVLARICLHAAGYSLRWDLQTLDPASLQMKRRDDDARVRELYAIADDALQKAMAIGENSLVEAGDGMNGFQRLFTNYCERNYGVSSQEFMWQLAELGTTTNCSFGVYNGQPGSSGGLYGSRKALQCKLPTYYLSFDPADNRRDVSCCDYTITYRKSNSIDDEWCNVGTTYSCITSGKFRIQWAVEPAAAAKRNIDIPMLRYADVLLMYAETQNFLNNGPTLAAKAALQQVRDRAGVGHLEMPSTQDAFLRALMQERQWEFADEFVLRSDLIRTNLLDDEVAKARQDLRDLSDRKGKYADVSVYRLYRYEKNSQTYGDRFLTVPFIDLTPEEGETIKTAPKTSAQLKTFAAKIQTILANRGITDGDWYAINMFEAWNSTYNKNCRIAGGFSNEMGSTIQLGASMYPNATGAAENAQAPGEYPAWIANQFYGYEKNKTEILPFANKSAGHPMVDNPNLTQHPGYIN